MTKPSVPVVRPIHRLEEGLPTYQELIDFWRGHARVLRECAKENAEDGHRQNETSERLGAAKAYEMCAWQLEYLRKR